jgi:hypothetical protein
VRVKFGERSLEAWAVGAKAAYHLHVPALYGRVIPARCRARAVLPSRKLILVLHKESDAEWKFLKS